MARANIPNRLVGSIRMESEKLIRFGSYPEAIFAVQRSANDLKSSLNSLPTVLGQS